MALPTLSDEQRAQNLKKAAEARHARAELREKIKNGDEAAKRMPVRALIESLPGYGKAKAAKIMDEIAVADNRRVQGLGARQREALLEILSK